MSESIFITNKHNLLCLNPNVKSEYVSSFETLVNNFCGVVFNDLTTYNENIYDNTTDTYLCGNINDILLIINFKHDYLKQNVFVIEEISYNYTPDMNIVNIANVPLNINNVGIYIKNCFDSKQNYFDLINTQHQFQTLTESNKPTNAFRTGIYLSNVIKSENDLIFNLLRCSSNFEGPTDNFRETDHEIIAHLNMIAKKYFHNNAQFNHVLAQIYENSNVNGTTKKAKIKQHSDKTKDMPRNGLMAFCTFYKDHLNNLANTQENDYCIKTTTILTKLRFRLKDPSSYPTLVKMFDIILYPNSVFMMSLTSNRLYTHEIVPSGLPCEMLPIRMGYVVRCSNTLATHSNGETYVKLDETTYVKLERPSEKDVIELKNKYFEENMTDNVIIYDEFPFSLNNGDYMKPNI